MRRFVKFILHLIVTDTSACFVSVCVKLFDVDTYILTNIGFLHTSRYNPPENYHMIGCQKIAKNFIFFQKNCQNCHFFKKIATGNFVEKNDNFCLFEKNVKFLAIF